MDSELIRLYIYVGMLILGIIIFLRLYRPYYIKDLLKRLTDAKKDYIINNYFVCPNIKNRIIAIPAIAFLCIVIINIWFDILWLIIFVSIILIPTILVVLLFVSNAPKEIKLEKGELIIKGKLLYTYMIKDLQDIKYTVGKEMRLYIKQNSESDCHTIRQHSFRDIKVLVILIKYIKSNELEKIEVLKEDDIEELLKNN
jgi:hypothetical protein